MNEYYFETQEFGISDDGIHLLRSRYNYKTINFSNLESVTIEKGKELNNWIIILIVGVLFVSFSIYYTVRLYQVITNHEVNVISFGEILVPLIPLMLGAYCIYSSIKNGTILRTKTTQQETDKFPLSKLEKENKLHEFQSFLKEKLGPKIRVNI
jgi:large-conductance mechanosensitive channel